MAHMRWLRSRARPRTPAAAPTVRVGTDVESIADVAEALSSFGARYADRVFTRHEIDSSGGMSARSAPGLAARFAAKESVLKILRPDDQVPGWHDIEVVRHDTGYCTLALSGTASRLAGEQGLHSFDVCLSHGAGVGTATVVAMATSR